MQPHINQMLICWSGVDHWLNAVTCWRAVDLKVIFLVGNKSDLDAQRDVTFEEAKQFAEENGERYIANYAAPAHVK